jgi:hypothetical protein
MPEERDPLEQFWAAILSHQPDRIRTAYDSLDPAERQQLIIHLQRMASEPGWQPGQRKSAVTALETLTGKTTSGQS